MTKFKSYLLIAVCAAATGCGAGGYDAALQRYDAALSTYTTLRDERALEREKWEDRKREMAALEWDLAEAGKKDKSREIEDQRSREASAFTALDQARLAEVESAKSRVEAAKLELDALSP